VIFAGEGAVVAFVFLSKRIIIILLAYLGLGNNAVAICICVGEPDISEVVFVLKNILPTCAFRLNVAFGGVEKL